MTLPLHKSVPCTFSRSITIFHTGAFQLYQNLKTLNLHTQLHALSLVTCSISYSRLLSLSLSMYHSLSNFTHTFLRSTLSDFRF